MFNGRQPPSFRARRTFATGVLMVLMCLGLSFLFLMYVGGKESDNALQKGLSAWNTVESLIQRGGSCPSVLPQADDEAVQVLNAHGTVVAASSQLAGEPPLATFRPAADKLSATQVLCRPAGLEGCRTVTSINVYQPDGIWSVYVATPAVPWYGNSTAVLLAIGASLLVTTAVTAWVFRGHLQGRGAGRRDTAAAGRHHRRPSRTQGSGTRHVRHPHAKR